VKQESDMSFDLGMSLSLCYFVTFHTSLAIVAPDAPASKEGEPDCPIWEATLKEWKLSQAQLDELQTLLVTVPVHKLPNCQKEDLDKAYYQYVTQKAAEIKRRNEQKRIRSRFSYLRKLMQEEKQPTQAVARGTQEFRNFTERQNNNYMDKVLKHGKLVQTTISIHFCVKKTIDGIAICML
jgi:hypothetical protein